MAKNTDKPTANKTAKAKAKPSKPADRSAAVAKSWKDKNVAAARSTKHHVKVKGEEYRSVPAAFEALKLPMEKMIGFRKELKASASGRATFKDDKKGNVQFTLLAAE